MFVGKEEAETKKSASLFHLYFFFFSKCARTGILQKVDPTSERFLVGVFVGNFDWTRERMWGGGTYYCCLVFRSLYLYLVALFLMLHPKIVWCVDLSCRMGSGHSGMRRVCVCMCTELLLSGWFNSNGRGWLRLTFWTRTKH